jgi:enoyl-CoA hydratase/carnithine racemase
MTKAQVATDLALVEKSDGIATITFNDPDRLNPLGRDMRIAVGTALAEADADPEVRCVILTGAGRAFSTGADQSHGDPVESAYDWYWLIYKNPYGVAPIDPYNMRTPVIGAINGMCYGAGMIHASECDLVVAAESAKFCMIETRMGHGGAGSLPYFIGPQWTRFLMYTGEIISARKAKEIGLVLEVVPDDELASRVRALATRIVAMPGNVVELNKQQINGTLEMMGWTANRTFGASHGAVLDSSAKGATLRDGRDLLEIHKKEGFRAFKEARDAAHKEPWLTG